MSFAWVCAFSTWNPAACPLLCLLSFTHSMSVTVIQVVRDGWLSLLAGIPSCEYTAIYFSVLQLMDIWVASNLGLLQRASCMGFYTGCSVLVSRPLPQVNASWGHLEQHWPPSPGWHCQLGPSAGRCRPEKWKAAALHLWKLPLVFMEKKVLEKISSWEQK